MKKSRN